MYGISVVIKSIDLLTFVVGLRFLQFKRDLSKFKELIFTSNFVGISINIFIYLAKKFVSDVFQPRGAQHTMH